MPSAALAGRIRAVRAALASRAPARSDLSEQAEFRVAASVTHLGLVARLVAPAVAARAGGHHLELRLGDVWWQDVIGGPVPLSMPGDRAGPRHSPAAAGDLGALVDDIVAPLTSAVSTLVPISGRVLWGNVASAVNGAAHQIAAKRPECGRQAWQVAAAIFSHPGLSRERHEPGPGFRRCSCCLIYRLATGRATGVCGDCVLRRPDT